MPTALLICMENTFWNISSDESDDNFMESFKKSFALYDESGMRKKIEADIVIFRNQGGHLMTKESKAKFCRFIVEHYLRKFHCFYLHLYLTTFFASPFSSETCVSTYHNICKSRRSSQPWNLHKPSQSTTRWCLYNRSHHKSQSFSSNSSRPTLRYSPFLEVRCYQSGSQGR